VNLHSRRDGVGHKSASQVFCGHSMQVAAVEIYITGKPGCGDSSMNFYADHACMGLCLSAGMNK
jgi:hypothetical protein